MNDADRYVVYCPKTPGVWKGSGPWTLAEVAELLAGWHNHGDGTEHTVELIEVTN